MRALEKAAFERGITAEALMDEAGAGIACAVARFFPVPGRCLVFAGKGNNAGDALVAAQHLSRSGWKIEMRLSFEEKDCGELMEKKLQSLRAGLRRDELPLVRGRAEASACGIGEMANELQPLRLTAAQSIERLPQSQIT